MRRIRPACLALCLMAALMMTGCASAEPVRVLRDDLMGTMMSITVYGRGASGAIDAAYARVEEIYRVCDVNSADSTVSKINALAGGNTAIPNETCNTLFDLSKQVYHQSNGAFNPAIGPLVRLWGIGTELERVPSQAEIDAALSLSAFGDVWWSGEDILLEREGMSLDFGGIAKGYACDEAVLTLKARGITSALLDLGGDIYALGVKPDGMNWKIGMRSPLGDNAVIGIFEISDTAVVTSGTYERYFEQDGQRYHHILDPMTGYPAESGLLSVTILHPESALADALSTACFVLGLEGGKSLIAATPDAAVIFITEDLSVYPFGEGAKCFTLTDDRFRLVSP